MTTAEILGINIPFMVLFLALWAGIPMWMIRKYPDRHPRETRTLPAYLRQRNAVGLPAQRVVPARAVADAERHERELVQAGRS
jgi:hypothetical protein